MKQPERRDNLLTIDNEFYVRATSSLADNRTRVLKYGETFGVFNRYGDIESLGTVQLGLFHMETRHLSRLAFYLGNDKPLLLNSTIRDDNSLFTVDATNLDTELGDTSRLPQGTIHIFRSTSLSKGTLHSHFRFQNYGTRPVHLWLAFLFDADFADIFEVRGTVRKQHGKPLPERTEDHSLIFGYDGLDGIRRQTRISFSPPPAQAISGKEVPYEHDLMPDEEWNLSLTIVCERFVTNGTNTENVEPVPSGVSPVFRTRLISSNKRCNSWLVRCQSDLSMLMEGNPERDYPYAGVPWFSTVFGRDGIITALECLWLAPAIARGVLSYLAETQATEEDSSRDAEPGKIIHEIRHGEMAATREVPFGRYYGSVDSTPLFLILAGAYFERTNDLEFLKSIWSKIEAALHWIDKYGDIDGDGFYEYYKRSENGLAQQGWKDSHDSIFHRDGRIAEPPIALCEMQGYVYGAKHAVANICARLGKVELQSRLLKEAADLKARFDSAFWNEELMTFVLALDGQKRQCEVRSSNAGHALFTKIASPARAVIVAETLLDAESFSGWGIRTIAAHEARYNPMSYHNGSVWPHDNALIGAGFANYSQHHLATRLLVGMFDAARHVDLNRLPELFCGFHRRPDGTGPTLYPVACTPQAWASGAPYLLLSATLGLEINAPARHVRFNSPHLPSFLDELKIEGLYVNDARIDLAVRRQEKGTVVDVLRKEGPGEIHLQT